MTRVLIVAAAMALAVSAAQAQEFEFRFSTTTAGPPDTSGPSIPPGGCEAPFGDPLQDGQSIQAYFSDIVAFGAQCVAETRTCSDGSLSGSSIHQECEVAEGAACSLPWGATLSHEAVREAFLEPNVAWSSTCVAENRECYDGTLSGSYSYPACERAEQDVQPQPFSFVAIAGQNPSIQVISEIVNIQGIEGNVPVTIEGETAEFRICAIPNCGTVTADWSTEGVIAAGQYVQLRMTTHPDLGQSRTATVAVGSGSADWTVENTALACSALVWPAATSERWSGTAQTVGEGACRFNSPIVRIASTQYGISYDIPTAEAFCRNVIGPQGRLAGISGPSSPSKTSVVNGGAGYQITDFGASVLSFVTCTTQEQACTSGEWFDGSACQPRPPLSCASLKADTFHKNSTETAVDVGPGQCRIRRPQFTPNNRFILMEESTLRNWAATLPGSGGGAIVTDVRPFSGTGSNYGLWRAPGDGITIVPTAHQGTLEIEVAAPGYGTEAVLPPDIPGY